MPLQSQLFRGNANLEAAAVSDASHILQGARGPHVGKIQSALNQLDAAGLAEDAIYGPRTASAVGKFKQTRKILNAQGKIDQIVGKKTIAALDSEMLARERGGGGGGGSGPQLNFRLDLITHTLFYFSGVADDSNNGGARLKNSSGDTVMADMENLNPVMLPDVVDVIGFGGSLSNRRKGVDSALELIEKRDPTGILIIYGFSAGGINSLDLCRELFKKGQQVDLLVTVDVANRRASINPLSFQEPIDRTVPANVVLNRNYFQTTPSLRGAVGGQAISRGGIVTNIKCDDRNFTTLSREPRHGQIQDLTRFDALRDMRVAIRKAQLTRVAG